MPHRGLQKDHEDGDQRLSLIFQKSVDVFFSGSYLLASITRLVREEIFITLRNCISPFLPPLIMKFISLCIIRDVIAAEPLSSMEGIAMMAPGLPPLYGSETPSNLSTCSSRLSAKRLGPKDAHPTHPPRHILKSSTMCHMSTVRCGFTVRVGPWGTEVPYGILTP